MNINSLGVSATAPASLVTSTPQQSAPGPGAAEQNRVLSQAVRLVNSSSSNPQDRQLSLSLDPVTRIAVAKVVDPTTGEVLDQVPTEDILRLAAYLEAQTSEEQVATQAAQESPR